MAYLVDHLVHVRGLVTAHKAEVVKQHETAVPLGPYPWHTKGSGWVQLWFTDDAELKYVFYDWAKGLSIRVIPVNKESGTVTVKCRSEVFDDASGHLTLQQDPWSQRITVSRAKEIILNEQVNWPIYVESVKVYEGKKRVVWEQNKLLEGTQLTLSLGLSDGSVRPPRACTRKRKAARALAFTNPNPNPRKRGKEGKEDEGQSGKKTKGPKKQTPAPVLKQTVEKKAQAQPKKKTAGAQREPDVDLTTPVVQQSRLLQQQQDYKSVTIKKVVRCQKLEVLLNSDRKWKKALQEDPGLLMTKIINFFAAHEDPATLLQVALRILNAVQDDDLKRNEARFWRSKLVTRVRVVLNAYNLDLNKVTSRINSIATEPDPNADGSGPNKKQVDNDKKADERTEVDFDSDVNLMTALANSMIRVKAGIPPEHVDASEDVDVEGPNVDNNASEDVEEPNVGKHGPTGEGGANKEVHRPKSERAKLKDFRSSHKAFLHAKEIPKDDEKVRVKFMQMYPGGYPDDKDFKLLGHYLTSSRAESGFKHITKCESYRSENWRVKMGNTIGRYFTLAKACEVAYWVSKKRQSAKNVGMPDTVTDAMFE